MNRARQRGSPHLVLPSILVFLAGGIAAAENIDPGNDGSAYAYGENVGWLNADPDVPGRPGVEVADFDLTGWLWGENIGWISLSCRNTGTCGGVEYGVLNDGGGVLSGFAWAENVGWIDFAPAASGVTIDPATGLFDGRALGENVGWISFADGGDHPYAMRTAWTCDPAPAPPADPADLRLDRSGTNALLSWPEIAGASGFDVLRGTLVALVASGGDYTAATDGCAADNRAIPSLTVSEVPTSGDALWFLVGPTNCGGRGSYGDATRDAAISASGNDCP